MKPLLIPALVALLASHSAWADGLPDLTISDLTVDAQCQVTITVKNLGPGALPPSAMYQGSAPNLSLSKDGDSHGGRVLKEGSLVPSGGTYVHIVRATNLLVDGQGSYTATIDSANIITESNEANNSLTRTLSCSPTKPDLALVSVELDNACRARLTIRNVGQAVLGAPQHGMTMVYREVDGVAKGTIRLADMDPTRKVAATNGSVSWTDWAEFKPTSNARYKLAVPTGNDANADNNEADVTVPDRCKAGNSGTTDIRKPLTRPKLPVQGITRH